MKNKILSLLALAAVPLAVKAQDFELVAGWDFGAFVFDGLASTDGVNFTNTDFIDANFSSSSGFNPVVSPVSTGTGSFNWNLADADSGNIQAIAGNTSINTVMGPNVFPGTQLSNGNSDPNNLALAFTNFNGGTFSVTVDMTGFMDYNPSDYSSFENFSFAAAADGAMSIDWALGGNSVGTTNIAAGSLTTFNTYTLDLPASFYGAESTLTATISGASTLAIDNVQANGVVPEPSTYAAIAGVIALGFAVYRRRK